MGVSGHNARQHYELSILAGVDSFAYTLSDRSQNALLAYRTFGLDGSGDPDSWADRLRQLIKGDDNLNDTSIGKTVLAWDSPSATLVPDALFEPSAAADYLESLTLIGLDDEVRHEPIAGTDTHLIYASNRDRLTTFEGLFEGRVRHPATGLLSVWAARSRTYDHGAVSCWLRGRRMFLAAHQSGELQYANGFTFASTQDAIYYLLLAYERSGCSAAHDPLYLCGEILPTGELYKYFQRYVADIQFCRHGASPTPVASLADVQDHRYFDLLSLT